MKRSPVKRYSKRRLKRDSSYQLSRRDVYDRADGRCELRIVDGCTGRCEQVHHIRGRGGPDPHALDGLLGLCMPCHQRVHASPAEAYERGWMVRRGGVG